MTYDLFAILKTIGNNRRTVLLFVVIAACTGVLLYAIIPTKYEAESIFILKNPIYADRTNLYNYEGKFLNYIANDDDVDQLISMASSDSFQNTVIRTMHLASVYEYDTANPIQVQKLKKFFMKHLKIYRNEHKNVVLTYTDKDAARAASVANLCVELLEVSLRGFYNGMRENMFTSVTNKIRQEDSTINALSDSLVRLREQYGIYDIISPARNNVMLSTVKGTGRDGLARGIEQVQNVESIKDQLVSDRAKHISLANQYSTGTQLNEMPLTSVIQTAQPPYRHTLRDVLLTIIVSTFLGLLYGIIHVLAVDYFRRSSSTAN